MVIYALILMILCQIFKIAQVKHPVLKGQYVPIPQICSVVMHNRPSRLCIMQYAHLCQIPRLPTSANLHTACGQTCAFCVLFVLAQVYITLQVAERTIVPCTSKLE